jgi:hypothetical protein
MAVLAPISRGSASNLHTLSEQMQLQPGHGVRAKVAFSTALTSGRGFKLGVAALSCSDVLFAFAASTCLRGARGITFCPHVLASFYGWLLRPVSP